MLNMLTLAAGDPGAMPDPMSHVLPHTLFGLDWFTNHHFMALVVLGRWRAAADVRRVEDAR